MDGPRREWVDVAKGFSIILVAIYHATLMFNAVGFDVALLSRSNDLLANIRMPTFFLAAGLFSASSIAQPWGALIKRRIGFFIYLFVLWTIIRFVFFAFVPNPHTPSEGHSLNGLLLTLLMPNTGLWFLWALAMYYFLVKFVGRIRPRVILLGAIAISVVGFVGPLPWVYNNVLKYFVFFYVAFRYKDRIGSLVVGKHAVFALALALCVAFAVVASWSDFRVVAASALLAGGACGVLAICAFANVIAPTAIGRLIGYLGRNTLGIYLAHVMLLAAMAQMTRFFITPASTGIDLALPLFATATSILLARLIEEGSRRTGLHSWFYGFPLDHITKSRFGLKAGQLS